MKNNHQTEFIKFAYQCGKVKEVEDAFIEFPIENEIHKGKVENVLRENSEEYLFYEIGDIVFVKRYQYQDGKDGQNHLFVIIEQNNLAVPIENFGMLISSKIEKARYPSNQLIVKEKNNGLKTNSIVKTDVIYKILNQQILFKIGKVEKDTVEEYKQEFYEINKEN